MSAWIARRECSRKTRSVSIWQPFCYATRSKRYGARFRKGETYEFVFRASDQFVGDGGSAYARGASGTEHGERGNHSNAGRRSVPPEGCGFRYRYASVAIFVGVPERDVAWRAGGRGGQRQP